MPGPEAWDFSWMAAAIQSPETYEAALETAEFPSLLLAALDELLQAPQANAAPLQELIDVLLQMIEFPIDLDHPRETVTLLHSTRDWAIQTVLNIRTAQSSAKEAAEDAMQPATMSASLQQLQAKLFVSAPCRQADVQMELNQSLLAAVGDEEQLSDAMEICATSLYDDAEFLQFAEAALSGKMESVAFGSAFLQRLFDRRAVQLQSDEQVPTASLRRGQRLFDALSLDSQIRVWANHLPSWRSQLQKWMLEAHRSPFQTLSAVLPDGWWAEDDANYAYSGTIAVAAVCRRHSHLYVTFVEWCRTHVNLLASCRSVELVCLLSQSLRQENTAHLFKRQLLSQVLSINHLSVRWSPEQRQRVFITLGRNLKRLQTTRSISDDSRRYEWIGILEQPHLLHEALESTFTGSDESEKAEKNQIGARAAAEFFGWFYSFSNVESAGEIAAIVTQMSAELKVSDVRDGAQWLRRSRADFDVLPILRLRIVWFWLLKSIDTELQTPASASNNTAAAVVTDVLESVEYIFRRFTPSWSRRPFQVELVTQLLVELEWRATHANATTRRRFLDEIAPLCAWLTKIVTLMQLEEHTAQKDRGNRYSSRWSSANDVEHLTQRFERFSCGNIGS